MTKVVHCKHELYNVYIGRPSIWGNPFIIGKDGTREEVIKKYEIWVKTQSLDFGILKNQILGCWCKPLACHGDILAKLADESN